MKVFFADRPKDFTLYQNDIRTKRAVERNVEIIGEAMNRILNKDATIEFSNAKKIVNTRNRIIHGHDTVSDEIIWELLLSTSRSCKLKFIPYSTSKVHYILYQAWQ